MYENACLHQQAVRGSLIKSARFIWTGELGLTSSSLRKKPVCTCSMSVSAALLANVSHT